MEIIIQPVKSDQRLTGYKYLTAMFKVDLNN